VKKKNPVKVNLRVHVRDHIHIHINIHIQRIQESRTQSKDRLQTQLEKLRADWCVCVRVKESERASERARERESFIRNVPRTIICTA